MENANTLGPLVNIKNDCIQNVNFLQNYSPLRERFYSAIGKYIH